MCLECCFIWLITLNRCTGECVVSVWHQACDGYIKSRGRDHGVSAKGQNVIEASRYLYLYLWINCLVTVDKNRKTIVFCGETRHCQIITCSPVSATDRRQHYAAERNSHSCAFYYLKKKSIRTVRTANATSSCKIYYSSVADWSSWCGIIFVWSANLSTSNVCTSQTHTLW